MAANGKDKTSTISGMVESSTSTGVRIEGVWYSLPRDLEARPPDRGARVELMITERHFVRSLRILEPAPEPAEADRGAVRASVLRSAAHFAGTHGQPHRSVDTLAVAASFEAWVYQPTVKQQDDTQTEIPPDRERRLKRESALSSVVEFLANKPDARSEDVLVLAEAWERWLGRPRDEDPLCENCGQALTESVFPDGTSRTVAQLASYGRERHARTLCQTCFTSANDQFHTPDTQSCTS